MSIVASGMTTFAKVKKNLVASAVNSGIVPCDAPFRIPLYAQRRESNFDKALSKPTKASKK